MHKEVECWLRKSPMRRAAIAYVFIAFSVATNFVAHSASAQGRVVPGHVPAEVTKLHPIGRADPASKLDLVLSLPLQNQERLNETLRSLYDPGSPSYRHFLTTQQFIKSYGPRDADYRQLITFSKSHHFEVILTHPNRTLLHVRARIEDIERTFKIQLLTYAHPVEDRVFYAPNVEPTVDSKISLLHVHGLDNLVVPHPQATGSAPGGDFTATDLRSAYAPNAPLDGTGQIVGVYWVPHGFDPADVIAYEDLYGITPHVKVTKILVEGTEAPLGFPSAEVTLDVSMAIAMAPRLSEVIIYEDNGSYLDALNRMANDNVAKQLSTSVTPAPSGSTATSIYRQFAAQGQSFFASSGDDGGYYSLIKDAPNAVPQWNDDADITIVGGTTLTTATAGGAWTSESVWNEGGGGWQQGIGGASKESDYPATPSWQQNIDMTANHGSNQFRNSPDVAMVASNINIIWNGTPISTGGTSASAPLWAGFMALVNQQADQHHRPPVGFANPALYALGKSPKYLEYFHDVTNGSNAGTIFNTQPGHQDMYPAAVGYDLTTGWGTPTGMKLINALASGSSGYSLSVSVQYSKANECDPGPIAGAFSKFSSLVEGGWPPYTYSWHSTNLPSTGQSSTNPVISVDVPSVGVNYDLTLVVTDAVGATATATANFQGTSADPAHRAEAVCKFVSNLYRFKRPIYVWPGDQERSRPDFYSDSDLKTIQDLAREILSVAP